MRRLGLRRRWRRHWRCRHRGTDRFALPRPRARRPGRTRVSQGLSAQPANLAAGANSDVNIHIGFSDPADQVKDLTVHLPPGLVGNPTATPLCTVDSAERRLLPGQHPGGQRHRERERHRGGARERAADRRRLALQPHPAAGRAGALRDRAAPARRPDRRHEDHPAVRGPAPSQRFRPGHRSSTTSPRTASGLETDITSLDLSLMGTANGKGFMRNPTSCTPAKTVTVDADVIRRARRSRDSAPPSLPPTATRCRSRPR